MLEIDSEAENTAINKELKRNNEKAWLGFTDRRSEGKWVLESTVDLGSGEAIFTAWREGEPNNNDHSKAENFAYTDSRDNKWNDALDQDPNFNWYSAKEYGALAACEM